MRRRRDTSWIRNPRRRSRLSITLFRFAERAVPAVVSSRPCFLTALAGFAITGSPFAIQFARGQYTSNPVRIAWTIRRPAAASVQVTEALVRGDQPLEQRRRSPVRRAVRGAKSVQRGEDLSQTGRVGVEHRTAAM